MAPRVLKTALLPVAAAVASLAAAGCPHDWASFESVPTEAPADASTDVAQGQDEAATFEAGPTENAVFAAMKEKPTVLAADAAGIVLLTLEGSVLACPHEGCALPTTIASNQHDPRSLAIGYGFVAWSSRGDNTVTRASRIPGASPAQQAKDPDVPDAVALSATKVFFSVIAANNLIRSAGIRTCTPGVDCQLTAPSYSTFADGNVTALKLESADAFWLDPQNNRVVGCPIATCEADYNKNVVLATEPVLPFALAVDADAIYYGSTLEGGSVRAVPRSRLAGDAGGGAHALAKTVGSPERLAVTPSSVWFTDPAGIVSRVSRKGGAVTLVAKGLAQPTGIAVGGGWVYVACTGDGRILRWKAD